MINTVEETLELLEAKRACILASIEQFNIELRQAESNLTAVRGRQEYRLISLTREDFSRDIAGRTLKDVKVSNEKKEVKLEFKLGVFYTIQIPELHGNMDVLVEEDVIGNSIIDSSINVYRCSTSIGDLVIMSFVTHNGKVRITLTCKPTKQPPYIKILKCVNPSINKNFGKLADRYKNLFIEIV